MCTEIFPERLTPYLKKCIANGSTGIARQFLKTKEEDLEYPWESDSPIGGVEDQVLPKLIRHYKDRALLLTTPYCKANCRFCFRRHSPQRTGQLSLEELDRIGSYLKERTEIKELLLSGGDPLTLPLERLTTYVERIRQWREDILLRYCTRLPLVDPKGIDSKLLDLIACSTPAVMVVHLNHPDELTPETVELFRECTSRGIKVWSQTVLLLGVNDRVEILEKLFQEIYGLGIKPHYLFQLDLAPGTSHFRVDLLKGIALAQELLYRIGEKKMPPYTVDIPYKGGKVNLLNTQVDLHDNFYVVTPEGGEPFTYPRHGVSPDF